MLPSLNYIKIFTTNAVNIIYHTTVFNKRINKKYSSEIICCYKINFTERYRGHKYRHVVVFSFIQDAKNHA